MKTSFLFLLVVVMIFSCSRNWDNPIDVDKDLMNTPTIVNIELNPDYDIVITLSYSYSESSEIILERKSTAAFEQIFYQKLSQSTLLDTSFDKETNQNFIYRFRVVKGEYGTVFSEEKQYRYESAALNDPTNLQANSIELRGVQLNWQDRSGNEESYKIEKDVGSGYAEIASLPANSASYLDSIPGTPPSPLQLSYRVQAYSATVNSNWVEIATNYLGIVSPTNFRITDSSSNNLTIQWQDNSSIEDGYSVERKKDSGVFEEDTLLAANTTLFIDKITETGLYTYRVRAKKNNLYSSYSNEVSKQFTFGIPTDGLLAYWPFSGNADDESGNGHNGTVQGSTLTNDRFGFENKAYHFDGNDYISVPDDTSFTLATKPFALSLWISLDQIGSYYIMGHDEGGGNTRKWIFWFTGSTLGLHERHNGGYWVINISWNPELNKWYYINLVRYQNTFSIYVDANLIGSNEDSRSIPDPRTSLLIGNAEYTNRMFRGIIDDVRFYSKSLTEEEIQLLYHEGGWAK